ncbi:MAG: type II toxin-antitoxin system RelE/ParE family toxin, partial [Lacticaseibacillus paracasei]
MYKIDFYEDRDGYSEIEDFLDQLRHSHQKNNVSLLNK